MSQTRGNLTCLLAIADVMAGELEDENEALRVKVKRQASELTAWREALEQRNAAIRFYKMRESRYILEDVKLRKLVRRLCRFAFDENPDVAEKNFARDLRELGIED